MKSMFSKSKTDKSNSIDYDKNVEFYFTNLINSIILFSLNKTELELLITPAFDPIFELESEIDYAFTPVCFETIFRNQLIDVKFKPALLSFKKITDEIPSEIWDWEFIETEQNWINVRKKANELLTEMGIKTREYNDDFTTIYDQFGKTLKKGKNCS
jgi:hypothetical protein